MSFFVVDCESDGPIIGTNSMVCFGAVLMDKDNRLETTFYGRCRPIGSDYQPEALAISGFTRKEHETFPLAKDTMVEFHNWINEVTKGRPVLLSDNNGYDAPWINWYFLQFGITNPFGWSSRRIGDMFAGFMNDPYYKWKKHRVTSHTHHPVDDAKGNAEALIWLQKQGYKIKFK